MSSDPDFHYRPHHNHFIDLTSTIAAGVSLVLCLSVLAAAGFIWLHKSARGYLDRISFRLSLWAMVAQVIQDIVYITLYAPTGLVDPTKRACGAGVLFRLALVGIVNYLFTCVAINLMLTIVFGVNPVRLRLERWYIGLSLFLGIIIPTIPACLQHFGWDPVFGTCYFTSDDRATRVRHFILDVYLWQIISCIVATVSVIMVLFKLFKQSRATQRLSSFRAITSTCSDEQCASCSQNAGKRGGLQRLLSHSRSQTSSGCTSASTPEQPTAAMYQLQDKLMGVALRISLYPMTLIVVNTIVTAGDLWTAIDQGIHTGAAYHMTVFHRLLCGGRGVLFAALCLFVDPCLYRGLRFLFRERRKKASEAKWEIRSKEVQAHDERNLTSDKDEKPQRPPAVDYVNYSPTYLPPGETPPGLYEDPLRLPDSIADPSMPWHSTVSGQNDHSNARRQDRLASDASMDFAQALTGVHDARVKRASSASLDFMSALRSGPRESVSVTPAHLLASPTALAAGQRDGSRSMPASNGSAIAVGNALAMSPFAESVTKSSASAEAGSSLSRSKVVDHDISRISISSDRSSFVAPPPAGWINFMPKETKAGSQDVERERSESQVSMDFTQALAVEPGLSGGCEPSGLLHAAAQASRPGPSNPRDRLASNVSIGLDEMLAQGPGARRRGSSAASTGLLSVLAAGPESRSSRLDSNVSMELDAVLAQGPPNRARQGRDSLDTPVPGQYQPRMASLGEGAPTDAGFVPRATIDPRRPSLPQRWKDAFTEEAAKPGATVIDDAKNMRARRTEQRRNERAQREWMRDLEKLYEEAEAQL